MENWVELTWSCDFTLDFQQHSWAKEKLLSIPRPCSAAPGILNEYANEKCAAGAFNKQEGG